MTIPSSIYSRVSNILADILAVLVLLFFFCVPAGLAASLEWKAIGDREQIVILKDAHEGVLGTIARIDKTGLLVTFSAMPQGLVLPKGPNEATIFKGSKQVGMALGIETKTAEFGFVVSQKSDTRIVIDLFPDPLGARWKKPERPPTATEIFPDTGKFPAKPQQKAQNTTPAVPAVVSHAPAKPDTAQPVQTQSGQAQPGHDVTKPSAATQDTATSASAVPVVTPSTAAPAVHTPEKEPHEAQTAISSQPVLPPRPQQPADQPKPAPQPDASSIPAPVVSTEKLRSAAEGEATPAAQIPPVPPLPEFPRLSGTPAPLMETDLGQVLDTRYDTRDRNAPLPLPGPISNPVAPQPESSLTQPEIIKGLRAVFGPSVAHAAQEAPKRQPARQRVNPAAPAASQAGATAVSAPATVPGLLPGVGVRGDGGAYKGRVHQGGLESIPLPLASDPQIQTALPDGAAVAVPPVATAPVAPEIVQTQPVAGQPVTGQASSATPEVTAPSPAPAVVAIPPVAEPSPVVAPAVQAPVAVTPAEATPAAPPAASPAPVATPAPQAASQPVPGVAQQSGSEQATVIPGSVAPSAPQETGTATPPRIIYVNEAGQEIERPKEPAELLQEMRAQVAAGAYTEALTLADTLIATPRLEPAQREEALHAKAEMLFVLNKDNLVPNAQAITDAANEAINFNLRSRRNAPALLRLGYLNLQLGNVPEAEARFAMLRRMFPNDENVPLSYYYWGDHHYNKNDMQQAADQFQLVLQKYPESRYAREAALGLARAFYRLGYYEQAFTIVEYIEQRWANFYLTYPPFLNMMGDVGFRLNKLDFALQQYWLYANIMPKGDETDIILTRIADIYTMQQRPKAAREVYREVVERFPGRDGALVSQMRLAEQHINDVPTLGSMFDSFEASGQYQPDEVYRGIISDYPESGLVPLARLKLAMWYLWNHNYTATLDTATEFLQAHPGHELTPKVRDVALKAFAVMATESVTHDSYGRMREVWERYSILQDQEEILTPESRMALALSYWKDNRPDDALVAVEPFFLGNKIPTYSEMALNLVLAIYLEYEQWSALEEVARRVQLWEISPEVQLQLDYALALSRENQDRPEAAAILWRKLYESKMLQDNQMVYATYFLARDAERRHRFDEAYLLGREALQRLKAEGVRNPGKEDIAKIVAQIGSLMALTEEGGRLGESLEYADQYLSYLPDGDESRASVLFRMARIYKKQGNEAAWRKTLTSLVEQYPNNVYSATAASMLNSEQLERDARPYAPGGML